MFEVASVLHWKSPKYSKTTPAHTAIDSRLGHYSEPHVHVHRDTRLISLTESLFRGAVSSRPSFFDHPAYMLSSPFTCLYYSITLYSHTSFPFVSYLC